MTMTPSPGGAAFEDQKTARADNTARPSDEEVAVTDLIYDKLADWWRLTSPPEVYAEQAAVYSDILAEDGGEGGSVLELGSGGGHVASHLKGRFEMTLCDRSPAMLRVSRALNPDVEHVEGDMRTVRLGRRFDRVMSHDAITYMTTEEDLLAAMTTAWVHLRPGGRALFTPDATADGYVPCSGHGGVDAADGRGARYIEWAQPVEPGETVMKVLFVYVMRHADGTFETAQELHVNGLFPRATWLRLMESVGFEAEWRKVPVADPAFGIESFDAFVGRRPMKGV